MKFRLSSSHYLPLPGLFFSARSCFLLAFLLSWVITAGCVQSKEVVPKPTSKAEPMGIMPDPEKAPSYYTDLVPITPQPDATAVQGGLKVWYFEDFYFKHIDELPKGNPPFSWGFEGKPLPMLDRKFERGENFYDSGYHRGISALIRGMIKFSEPGEYDLIARSNDGIRIFVGDKKVIDDPTWHGLGDEPTPEARITISKSGWYRFRLKFFQRKGTATLQMYWKKPGDKDFSYIPAEAYGHLPN